MTPELPMENQKLLAATAETRFSAHHLLIQTAQLAVKRCVDEQAVDARHDCLVALVSCALAVEAMCNSMLERLFEDDWQEHERLRPMEKLKFICQQLRIDFHLGKRPWQFARWLMIFRDEIAHAKPDNVLEHKIIRSGQLDDHQRKPPLSTLEKKLTKKNAATSIATVLAIKTAFEEKVHGFASRSWTVSASDLVANSPAAEFLKGRKERA